MFFRDKFSKLKHRAVLGSITCMVFVFSSYAVYADQLSDARNVIKKWVDVEKTISSERSTWSLEKAQLNDLLSSLNQEERILKQTIANATKNTSRADQERLKLISKRNDYQNSSALFQESLALYERQALSLIPNLPIILRDEMGLLINRLNSTSTSNYSLSERAQTLVSLLIAIQEFDGSITVAREIRTLQNGDEVEVKVLFLGLSRAFYVDSAKSFAGIGRPADGAVAGGWQWLEQNDLADEVQRAINIYENRESPALISLPLDIKKN